jgi:hypothetical protein
LIVDEGELVRAGERQAGRSSPHASPDRVERRPVAKLAVDGDVDEAARPFLERVALLISAYCLVGWDTGGEAWSP